MVDFDRRRVIHLGGAALAAGLAGCSSPSESNTDPTTDGTTRITTAATTTGGSRRPPGGDVLGGRNDLQSEARVTATILDADQGAGQYVFTPAVAWVESGTTVTWQLETGSHSVTAYHPKNDRPRRVPDGAQGFDSGTLTQGDSFEHTFETPGVYNYFCRPHESLGMVGIVVVDGPQGGPGTTPPSEVTGKPASHLAMQLTAAGIEPGAGDDDAVAYDWTAATWDSYWYSLYNMSTNISMSGNGVPFPANEEQRRVMRDRLPAMLEAANVDRPPVKQPNLNLAPFTTGDPHFTQRPVFDGGDGRPDATTLQWDRSRSSSVVSPSSLAWTHLKGVTWAKNFENHFDVLPPDLAPRFRSMILSTLAQASVAFALVHGNLRLNSENMLLASGWSPERGIVDDEPRVRHHAAMLWFLSDLVSLSQGGWFGYENPTPVVPPENLQKLTDGVAKTTMSAFPPERVASTRDAGVLLGAVGWYGTHAGSSDLQASAASYANALASTVSANVDDNGKVAGGGENQAATQGAVGQGLLWASQVDGVDHTSTARSVLGYLADELYDADAGTYASRSGASTYRITARDAGDITGGVNAADAVLGTTKIREQYASFYDQTFNRGRLQRAERPPSRDEAATHTLPLPPNAGGQYGQAAVYNAAVEYDVAGDEWRVADPTFECEQALYLANQDIWISQWGGDFFQGRGVPGASDTPE